MTAAPSHGARQPFTSTFTVRAGPEASPRPSQGAPALPPAAGTPLARGRTDPVAPRPRTPECLGPCPHEPCRRGGSPRATATALPRPALPRPAP